MKPMLTRWLSAMLALCLLLSLAPAALMEGETEAQAVFVEETAPTADGEDQAEPAEEAAEPASDDAAEPGEDEVVPDGDIEAADVEITSEPVDAVVDEIEDTDLLDLPMLEAQSEVDELDLDALEGISIEANDASAMFMEAASIEDNSVFPDANFREYLKEFDTDGDGSLSDEERAAVTEIQILDTNLSNLEGIKLFPNLEILDCRGNQLTEIDVRGMTELRELWCEDNKLTSINVKGCSNLERIHCSNISSAGNQLKTLDIRELNKLVHLYCKGNQIKTLDVSQSPSLTIISCDDNQLKDLDVSACKNLFSLRCNNNKLEKLNVNGCTVLKYLECDNNNLKALDVSSCAVLQNMRCMNNQLSVLDLSKCVILKSIISDENRTGSDFCRYWGRHYNDPNNQNDPYEDTEVVLLCDTTTRLITEEQENNSSSQSTTDRNSLNVSEQPTPTTSIPAEPVTIAKTPASVKAKAGKKGKVTVSWKKIKKNKKTKALLKQITGVQVQYSTDPNFAANTVTKTVGKKKTKLTLKGLQKKTVYYIRVRYVGAGGVSNWSAVKKVKTKK